MNLSDTPAAGIPQGDPRLLGTPTAQRLLNDTTLLARLAYVAKDGAPRLIPMNFLWNGNEVVLAAFAGTYKIADLRARPDVAITIDTADGPPQALMVRGKVTLAEVEGVLPEYATMQRAGRGEEQGNAYVAAIDKPGLRMVRIGLRPAWVGVLDFRERFPALTPKPVLAALGDNSQ